MSYKLTFNKIKNILKVQIVGERNYNTITEASIEIMQVCAQQSTTKALIDVRKFDGHLNILEIYKLADNFFPKIRDRRILNQCAIVDCKDFKHIGKFFEDVVINRMFNIRIFTKSTDAMKWLKD